MQRAQLQHAVAQVGGGALQGAGLGRQVLAARGQRHLQAIHLAQPASQHQAGARDAKDQQQQQQVTGQKERVGQKAQAVVGNHQRQRIERTIDEG